MVMDKLLTKAFPPLEWEPLPRYPPRTAEFFVAAANVSSLFLSSAPQASVAFGQPSSMHLHQAFRHPKWKSALLLQLPPDCNCRFLLVLRVHDLWIKKYVHDFCPRCMNRKLTNIFIVRLRLNKIKIMNKTWLT